MIQYYPFNISKLSHLLLWSILCTHQKVGGVQSFASNIHRISRTSIIRRGIGQVNPRHLSISFAKVPRGGNHPDEKNDLDSLREDVEMDALEGGSEESFSQDSTPLDEIQHGYHELSISEALEELADNPLQTPLNVTMLSSVPEQSTQSAYDRVWPCGDQLDQKLIKIALPCIANFAINPLVGAVDLFWINRMGNTLAVAGQAAANQIFSSAFWLTSFLPSVTATLVAKEFAKGSEEGVQDSICQALLIGCLVATCGSWLVLSRPDALLGGVLKDGAPARVFARPYLLVRGLAFLPSLVSLIGFSAFRGMMDTITPLKISLFANILNAILDPILIFKFKWGVTGAAVATLMSEVASAVIFITMMIKKNLIVPSKLMKKPKLERLAPLLKGGAALQLRNFALNLTFLAVTRVTQSIDETGVAAAAHAMAIQTFQIGGIVLLALSTVAQFVIPGEMVEKIGDDHVKRGGLIAAKACVNRLMSWGFVLGTILAALQIVMIPFLQKATPIEDVRKAAQIPSVLASIYQCFNGLVFIGEGVMVGTGSFMQLSISTMIATLGTLLALREFPSKFGLTGVWMSFGVFNTLRLAGVVYHQRYNGPLSDKRLKDDLTSSANYKPHRF